MARAVSTEEILPVGTGSGPIGKDYSVLQECFTFMYSFHHVVQLPTLGMN